MFDQENILKLISLSIITTCLLDSVWYYWEKLHVNPSRNKRVKTFYPVLMTRLDYNGFGFTTPK